MTLLFLKTITDYPLAYISGNIIELIAWSPLILDIMHYNKSIWHVFATGGIGDIITNLLWCIVLSKYHISVSLHGNGHRECSLK